MWRRRGVVNNFFYFYFKALMSLHVFYTAVSRGIGDFLHKRLTFAWPAPTRKRCLVVRTMMTAAAVALASWTVFAGGGRCVCLFPCSLGGECWREFLTALRVRPRSGFVRCFRSCAPFDASERGFFVPEGLPACVACPEGNGYSDGMLRTFNPAAASRPLYDHS